jgi:hypothetical protein
MYRMNLITVEARQLIGTAAETMDIINWVRNAGEYPWLLGNANEPETLIPEGTDEVGGEGVYIDPSTGNLVIHTHAGDEKASYGFYVVRHEDGRFEAVDPDVFEDKYEPA